MASIVTVMTTAQIAALTTSQIVSLTTTDTAALTTDQIVALTTAQAAALSGAQVNSLADITKMEVADFAALNTAAIAALNTTVAAALTSAQVVALTTTQAAALTAAQVDKLADITKMEVADVAALKTAVVAALSTSQIIALTTNQIAGLTTNQVGALTTTQVCALSTAGLVSAFTTTQISHLALATPLVLDLNGDGISTVSITSGVQFDLYATGQKVSTGWVAPTDGLLVLDRNHDGVINDGSELFGSSTTLSNGQRANNGYSALAEMDTNSDGLITSSDAAFSDLKIWIDSNSDGLSQSSELKTLDSLGITKLNVNAQSASANSNGNWIGLESNYQTIDGTNHVMADVWFVADKNANAAATLPAVVVTGLQSQVGGLVQAIGSFNASQSAASSSSGAPVINSLPNAVSAAGAVVPSVNVSGMVEALKQFDQNGNPVGAFTITQSVSTAPSLTMPSLPNLANSGILAASK